MSTEQARTARNSEQQLAGDAKISWLRTALSFYADERRYDQECPCKKNPRIHAPDEPCNYADSVIQSDAGMTARAALLIADRETRRDERYRCPHCGKRLTPRRQEFEGQYICMGCHCVVIPGIKGWPPIEARIADANADIVRRLDEWKKRRVVSSEDFKVLGEIIDDAAALRRAGGM